MLKVYHCKVPNFFGDRAVANNPQNFEHVANVETNNLEVAFAHTQHIDAPWTQNKGVHALVAKPRSTSVGDVIEKDGVRHMVGMIGFVPLN